MIRVLTVFFVLCLLTSPAWAISLQGQLVLSHEGVDHIGTFTFDPTPLPETITPFTSVMISLTSFHMDFVGIEWAMPGNFIGWLQFSAHPLTLSPAFPNVYAIGQHDDGGRLQIYTGDLRSETGPATGAAWVYEPPVPLDYSGPPLTSIIGIARTTITPEPSTWILLLSGLVGLAIWRRANEGKV